MISEKVDKQLVFGLKDASGRLKYVKKLMDVDREKAKRELVQAVKDIYLQIDKVESVISDLKNYRCYGNLKNNIQSLLNRLRRNTYIEIKLLFKQGLYEYQPEEQMIILDIIEESCMNAIVHSHTKDIVVGVRKEEKLEFYIKDRGVGFNVEGVTASGIDIMKLKCDMLNGEFTIVSKPGEGTTILVRI